MHVFVETDRFKLDEPQYNAGRTIPLPEPTDDLRVIVKAALWGLRDEVFYAMEARPKKVDLLFCTRKGTSYYNEEKANTSGWDSMWQRFMDWVMAETKVKESFTDPDLRAKCASDAETLEQARALLAHADARRRKSVSTEAGACAAAQGRFE